MAPPGQSPSGTHASLLQTLRSEQVAASSLPAFWRFGDVRIAISRVVVAHQVGIQQAVLLSCTTSSLSAPST